MPPTSIISPRKSKQRQRYTTEFKSQAVELTRTGKPVSQIAEELCIGSNLLHKWKAEVGAPSGSEASRAACERSEAEDLRAPVKDPLLKQENDIFKTPRSFSEPDPNPSSVNDRRHPRGRRPWRPPDLCHLAHPRSSYYHAAAPTARPSAPITKPAKSSRPFSRVTAAVRATAESGRS